MRKFQKLLNAAHSDQENSSISSAKRVFPTAGGAVEAFADYRTKIFNLNIWNQIAGIMSFEIFDGSGKVIFDKTIRKNSFLRLSMTGSLKYDWVKVIDITQAEAEIIIRVRPSFDPTEQETERAEASHFFTSKATNNFCLLIDKATVLFYVIGLNESQNTAETKNTFETIRNVITANVGSYLGIQQSEWESFCHKFLGLSRSEK